MRGPRIQAFERFAEGARLRRELRLDFCIEQPTSFDRGHKTTVPRDSMVAGGGLALDERVTHETNESDKAHENTPVIEIFIRIEHWITMGIGAVLIIATLLVLTGTVAELWSAIRLWPQTGGVFEVVDQLLFVLMLVEILHTVRASIETNRLAIEPFLIVGLIATVRRILVVTLETSGISATGHDLPSFDHAMVELGVLGGLTLVLIFSIYMSRRSRMLMPNGQKPG